MRTIVNLILRIANLVEAEGRLARENIFELAVAILLVAAATILLVVGVLTAGAAAGLALTEIMHPAWAMAIIALVLLGCAAGIGAYVRRTLNDRWTSK